MGGGARLSVAVWAFQHVGSRVCGTAQAGLVSIRFDVVLSGMPNKKSSDSGSSEEYSYVPEDVDALAEGMEEAPRDRRKTKKRRRERKSSPTPEVTRGRKGPRTPPGSSDGEDAAFKVRRGPGRSFIVSF